MDAYAVTDPCFRRHRYPVRLTDGKYPWYRCAWCGEMWAGGRNMNAPKVPQSWDRISLGELQVHYARMKIGAKI